jgi:hypothetical protein
MTAGPEPAAETADALGEVGVGTDAEPDGHEDDAEDDAEDDDGLLASPLRILSGDDPVDVVDFGSVDMNDGSDTLESQERTLRLVPVEPLSSVALWTDPPLLVAGRDADAFRIVEQPSEVIPAGGVIVTAVFQPQRAGPQRGALVLAYGPRADQRLVVTLLGEGVGPPRLPGVRAMTYDGTFDALPSFATLTPTSWATQDALVVPAERIDTDLFAVLLVGFVDIPQEGMWQFFSTSDDGSAVFIDGAVVVWNDGLHGPLEASGSIALTAGLHALEVQFFEKGGGEHLVVEWAGPERPRETVPASALFYSP